MPQIPYFIVDIIGDPAVNKAKHSDKLVPKMKEYWLDVTYIKVPGTRHCGPIPEDVSAAKLKFIIDR